MDEERRGDQEAIDYTIWSKPWDWGNVGWGPPEGDRVVRYRRSRNGIYQEVILGANGHYSYGLYMPEGFVPPKGME